MCCAAVILATSKQYLRSRQTTTALLLAEEWPRLLLVAAGSADFGKQQRDCRENLSIASVPWYLVHGLIENSTKDFGNTMKIVPSNKILKYSKSDAFELHYRKQFWIIVGLTAGLAILTNFLLFAFSGSSLECGPPDTQSCKIWYLVDRAIANPIESNLIIFPVILFVSLALTAASLSSEYAVLEQKARNNKGFHYKSVLFLYYLALAGVLVLALVSM